MGLPSDGTYLVDQLHARIAELEALLTTRCEEIEKSDARILGLLAKLAEAEQKLRDAERLGYCCDPEADAAREGTDE
jgi:hypothetical protein